jgi:orotidine-5'-phosphate decarboxylase
MKLCVALDRDNFNSNISLVKELKEFDNIWLKVGFRSFIRDGRKIIDEIKNINPEFKIFLDLKLYDIPNTMADASEEISQLPIDMFNIHASAGVTAMQTVMNRLNNLQKRPLVLSVTALTSFDEVGFKNIYGSNLEEKAIEFAKNSHESGIDGVVSSVFESKKIKTNTSNDFITLTPGVRPFETDSKDDQQRVANISEAKKELVDFIVVGRPIYKSDDPRDRVKKILEML